MDLLNPASRRPALPPGRSAVTSSRQVDLTAAWCRQRVRRVHEGSHARSPGTAGPELLVRARSRSRPGARRSACAPTSAGGISRASVRPVVVDSNFSTVRTPAPTLLEVVTVQRYWHPDQVASAQAARQQLAAPGRTRHPERGYPNLGQTVKEPNGSTAVGAQPQRPAVIQPGSRPRSRRLPPAQQVAT